MFLDVLLQANLTERQVTFDPDTPKMRLKIRLKDLCVGRSWRTAWSSPWLDAPSLPTVGPHLHLHLLICRWSD